MNLPKPVDILAESFRIIEREVGPHTLSGNEWAIVRRMIHASGDLDLLGRVLFHHDPITAALQALTRPTTVVTDVTMVLAGIHQPSALQLHVALRCFLNEPGIEEKAHAQGMTRSACAMEHAIRQLQDGIFVVGNAPTALLTLCRAVQQNRVRPDLIVAMPVGFVAVAESKEEALRLSVPVITLPGRKGGSAMAAAVVNALFTLALQRNAP